LHQEKRKNILKRARKILDNTLLQQEGFTVVSTDESFFFFDSLVRRVWIKKDERPIVKVTGSHQSTMSFIWCHKS
jgi:hypothetical protein